MHPFLKNAASACAVLFCLSNAHAAGPGFDKTLNIDLAPKIDAAISKPERFAVSVPHAADIASAGSWERAAGQSVWRYSVRIPTAVSMSFHAKAYQLPPGASLTVIDANGHAAVYAPADGGPTGLWSRTTRGDNLRFELRVSTSSESLVRFAIASLQAGYRGLGGGVPDHPHYRKLRQATQSALATGCVENFACHATPENSNNADATAAIIIGGVAQCTGTLINNLRNDGTAYLLSARHCQDAPESGVVVYWDAIAPCGAVLGAIYDTATPAYLNTTDTVFEQQDVWLMRLSSPLNATRVYFAGWDVTGGAIIGGYSPHHALGLSRQYAEWWGQAALVNLPGSVLGMGFDSSYWGLVNSVGQRRRRRFGRRPVRFSASPRGCCQPGAAQ